MSDILTVHEVNVATLQVGTGHIVGHLNRIVFSHEALRAERDVLRTALIACGRAAGGAMSDDVSSEFLAHVPEEVRLAMARLRPQPSSAQEPE